jgi:hypothetical protein
VVETKRHGDAFDYYYSLGAERSCQKVANKFTVSRTSVNKWKTSFNWHERVIQRDIEINRKTEAKTNKAIVNTKADYRADIKKNREELVVIRSRFEKLIADATAKIAAGEIAIKDVSELDRVASSLKKLHDLDKDYINLDLKLIGEDIPDRSDLNIKLELPKDLNLDDII